MMTLKEYADQAGVSYETVRRLVNKHMDALKDHITMRSANGYKYLDEYAVSFLNRERGIKMFIVDTDEKPGEGGETHAEEPTPVRPYRSHGSGHTANPEAAGSGPESAPVLKDLMLELFRQLDAMRETNEALHRDMLQLQAEKIALLTDPTRVSAERFEKEVKKGQELETRVEELEVSLSDAKAVTDLKETEISHLETRVTELETSLQDEAGETASQKKRADTILAQVDVLLSEKETLESEKKALADELERLRHRGFFARLFNRR